MKTKASIRTIDAAYDLLNMFGEVLYEEQKVDDCISSKTHYAFQEALIEVIDSRIEDIIDNIRGTINAKL